MELRDYQRAAIDGLYAFWSAGGGNALLDVPTAGGKSFIQAQLMREAIEAFPETRIISVTHVKELIRQNYDELMLIWSEAPAGIYSAGIGQRDTDSQIIFCGIQSVYHRVDELILCDILIVDEAHLIPRKSSTMYQKFITELKGLNPDMKVCGMTATPFRLDSGRLDEGDDALFDGTAYTVPVRKLIDDGYLAPLVPKAMKTELDVSGVHLRGGEFIPAELQAAVDIEAITEAALDECEEYGKDRLAWLLFCSGVKHAKNVCASLVRRGIDCEIITADTPKSERDKIVEDFKTGELRALSSVGVLTTGFNAKQVDLIAFLRPTNSTGLYIQMAGRGMRTHPLKKDCLVLDFARNVFRHGPIDDPDIKNAKWGKKKGEAPVKKCPECQTIMPIAVKVCLECGFEFPAPKPKIKPRADTLPILTPIAPKWSAVSSWRCARHQRNMLKPPTLRVEYKCGLSVKTEWVCFQHTHYPRTKAMQWWVEHGGHLPIPLTVNEAILRFGELNRPTEILTKQEGKFINIIGRNFHPIEDYEKLSVGASNDY